MKKIRKEIEFKSKGGFFDLFDNVFKSAYNITDEEYDYICEHATDEELNSLLCENPDFSNKRKALIIRNKYLVLMKENKSESI
jgi:hypothetical protein